MAVETDKVEPKERAIFALGNAYRLFGATTDRVQPYYESLACEFLEAFLEATPMQSVEAFFTCHLAEHGKFIPEKSDARQADKFPQRTRQEYAKYQRSMVAKRKPWQENRKLAQKKVDGFLKQLDDLQRVAKINDMNPEQKAEYDRLQRRVSSADSMVSSINKRLAKLQTKPYAFYYNPSQKQFDVVAQEAEKRFAAHVNEQDWQELKRTLKRRKEDRREHAQNEVPHFIKNLTAMAADLGLKDKELRLLVLLATMEYGPPTSFLRTFVKFASDGDRENTNHVLGRMIGMKPDEVAELIGPESHLRKQGLIESLFLPGELMSDLYHLPLMNSMYRYLLSRPNIDYDSLKKQLFGEVQKTDLSWPLDFDYIDAKFYETIPNEIFGHRAIKEEYLKNKQGRPPEGLPYMFVGPTRSGKSEAVIALAERCGMKPILIGQNMAVIGEDGKERQISLSDQERIQQVRSAIEKYKNSTDVLLVLDEFDNLFPKNVDYYGKDDKKQQESTSKNDGAERSEFQTLIKESGLPIVFTSNVAVDKVHPAVVARMNQVVEVKMPLARGRHRVALRRLSDHGIAVMDGTTVMNAEALASFGFDDAKKYKGSIHTSELNELARFQIMSGEISKAINKACADSVGESLRLKKPVSVDFPLLEKHFVMISNQNHGEVELSGLDELGDETDIAEAEPIKDLDLERQNLQPSTTLGATEAIAGYTGNPENRLHGVVIDGPGDHKTKLATHIVTRMEMVAVVVRPRNLPDTSNISQMVDEVFRKAKAEGKAVIFTEEGDAPYMAPAKSAPAATPQGQQQKTADKKEEKTKGFSETAIDSIREKAEQHQTFTALVLDRVMGSPVYDGPNGMFNFRLHSKFLQQKQLEKLFEEKTGVTPQYGIFNGLDKLTERDMDASLAEARIFGVRDFANNQANSSYLQRLLSERNKGQTDAASVTTPAK